MNSIEENIPNVVAKLIYNKEYRETKTIASKNPIWNQLFGFSINLKKEVDFPKISIELWDINRYTNKTFLGEINDFNLIQLLKQESKWVDFDNPIHNNNNRITKLLF